MTSVWTSRRALKVHVVAAVVVPGCLALGWWQLQRALSGNTLSWAYTFEWPVFAGYAVYMWWKLLHDPSSTEETADETAVRSDTVRPGEPGRLGGGPGDGGGGDEEGGERRAAGLGTGPPGADADELAAYNDYLAALHASGRRKRW
ncbi:MAG: hypothetical protein ABSG81_08180 [Acidimicrobiales bacterium]